MGPFEPELGQLEAERARLLASMRAAKIEDRPRIKQDFDRVHARIGELLKLQHDWMIGALDAVIDRLESILREERQRASSITAPIEDLVDRLAKDDTATALPPAAPVPGTTAPPTPGPTASPPAAGFRRDALAALAEREARRELVLGDPAAEKYVIAFKDALSDWRTMAWCAAFVHWCCNELGANLPVFVPDLPGGLPGVRRPTFAYNVAWKAWAEAHGWFRKRNGFTPAAGDLVVFDWDADGRNDHIAVVIGFAQGELFTAEGNTRNSSGHRDSSALKRRKMSAVDGFIRLPDGLSPNGAAVGETVGTGAAAAEAASAPVAATSANAADILARTLWGEARGDGQAGMEAVACVVLNRVKRGEDRWGRTIAEVCTKDRQFSCWNIGDPNRKKMLAVSNSNVAFKKALAIADRAIAGTLADVTFGATHYHTREVHPEWSVGKQPCFEQGDHLFYNNID